MKPVEQSKPQQFVLGSILLYTLAAFTPSFQTAWEVNQRLESNPVGAIFNVNALASIQLGFIDSLCWKMGQFTAWVI